jgi:hypothetical protein
VADQALAKALIAARELGDSVECRFNPHEYVVMKSATWTRTPVRGAQTAPLPEFVGTNPSTLQMELMFDEWESGSGEVAEKVEKLLSWTNPTPRSISANTPAPPIVYFQWGSRTLFDAFLRSVSARYTLFKSDGAPLRANVTVVFEEVPSEPARQNPTSGGRTGERARLVKPGDSLQSIAYQEYGDPTRWRRLAAANDIDDPLRLEAGTQLRIPAGRTDGGRS